MYSRHLPNILDFSDSAFLSTYMSSHIDTLVAYVLYYAKVEENLSTAKMTSIDQNVG
jgi:Protein of unknown function (DUF2470)